MGIAWKCLACTLLTGPLNGLHKKIRASQLVLAWADPRRPKRSNELPTRWHWRDLAHSTSWRGNGHTRGPLHCHPKTWQRRTITKNQQQPTTTNKEMNGKTRVAAKAMIIAIKIDKSTEHNDEANNRTTTSNVLCPSASPALWITTIYVRERERQIYVAFRHMRRFQMWCAKSRLLKTWPTWRIM